LVEGVHVNLPVGHLQVIEPPAVCRILGVANNKEKEVDSVEVTRLKKVWHQPKDMMILVLSRTFVKDNIQLLPFASLL
jgi:hypothetical protein